MPISKIYTEEDGNQYVIHCCDKLTYKDGWLIGTCSLCPGFIQKIKTFTPYTIEITDPEKTLFQNIQTFHVITSPIMRTLKDLTPDECKIIANIIDPEFDWKLLPHGWDGFDLAPTSLNNFDPIIQIDYRTKEELVRYKETSRFRLYLELDPIKINESKLFAIFKLLETINVSYEI